MVTKTRQKIAIGTSFNEIGNGHGSHMPEFLAAGLFHTTHTWKSDDSEPGMFRDSSVPGYRMLIRATARNQSVKRGSWMPNDGERGEMYAELERACDELDKTLEVLKKAGYTLREFSKGLETDPTAILVTHFPDGYMIYPDEINKTPWEYQQLRPIVDLDYLIELLKRARQLKRAKIEIERRLGKKLVPLS